MSGVENKLDQMINLLKRGGSVHLDSVKMGTVQAVGYSSFA